MHLTDAFIQSDLNCIKCIICQFMHLLGIDPLSFDARKEHMCSVHYLILNVNWKKKKKKKGILI